MDEETDFDVIVIGAGFAGASTAFQLLKEGIEGDRILVVDRGEPIGSKNLTGGILWGRELDDFEEYIGNWSKADKIRDTVRSKGWIIEDLSVGYKIKNI